jgi:protein tyrosine phosphatase
MVWEQDVKVLVCLTAEMERGQVKCHPYWKTGQYGPLRVTNFAESHIPLSLDSHEAPRMDRSPRDTGVDNRTNEGHNPCIIARHISLSHSALPFQPLREIIQLQYPYWPDFGTTAQPSHLVELIEQCDLAKSADTGSQAAPMLVHCSAGCGRTGSFCTVDSVLDAMKRGQRQEGQQDLIAQTVEEFRTQRPSMVQNLSQFVLCYESVLEWMAPRVGDDAMQHD